MYSIRKEGTILAENQNQTANKLFVTVEENANDNCTQSEKAQPSPWNEVFIIVESEDTAFYCSKSKKGRFSAWHEGKDNKEKSEEALQTFHHKYSTEINCLQPDNKLALTTYAALLASSLVTFSGYQTVSVCDGKYKITMRFNAEKREKNTKFVEHVVGLLQEPRQGFSTNVIEDHEFITTAQLDNRIVSGDVMDKLKAWATKTYDLCVDSLHTNLGTATA